MNENILKIDNSRYEIEIHVVKNKGKKLEKHSLKIEFFTYNNDRWDKIHVLINHAFFFIRRKKKKLIKIHQSGVKAECIYSPKTPSCIKERIL